MGHVGIVSATCLTIQYMKSRPIDWLPESAHATAYALADLKTVVGLIAFGSVARSATSERSDVDLLAICREPDDLELTRAAARVVLSSQPASVVSLEVHSVDGLERELLQRPSFGTHLRDEGVVLKRTEEFGRLERTISAFDPSPSDLATEMMDRLNEMEGLTDPARMNGRYVAGLARIYSLARALVIADLVRRGEKTYDWHELFKRYGEIYPELQGRLSLIESLRPYYDHVHDRRFLSHGQRSVRSAVMDEAVDALRTLGDRQMAALNA